MRGRGEGALRCSPFEVTQFPLLPVAFRSLSLSFSLSLSPHYRLVDGFVVAKKRIRVTIGG